MVTQVGFARSGVLIGLAIVIAIVITIVVPVLPAVHHATAPATLGVFHIFAVVPAIVGARFEIVVVVPIASIIAVIFTIVVAFVLTIAAITLTLAIALARGTAVVLVLPVTGHFFTCVLNLFTALAIGEALL
jgi:hypothetical protein